MRLTARLLIRFLIFSVFLVVSFYYNTSSLFAAGNLSNAGDVLNNGNIGAINVQHVVSFTLPINSQMITSTDYINIQLTYFSNVTAPTSVSGTYMGTPSFSVSNRTAKITGIVVLPGNAIDIMGITASNPPDTSQFQVLLVVSEDEAGSIIKNITSIQASTFNGNISVTATLIAPVSSVTISGYSAPGTFITFTENGGVIGTDTAGSGTGYFSKYFTGIYLL